MALFADPLNIALVDDLDVKKHNKITTNFNILQNKLFKTTVLNITSEFFFNFIFFKKQQLVKQTKLSV